MFVNVAQSKTAASTKSRPARAIHVPGRVTRTALSSCSGDESRSSACFLKGSIIATTEDVDGMEVPHP
jgi:hypothetical protein